MDLKNLPKSSDLEPFPLTLSPEWGQGRFGCFVRPAPILRTVTGAGPKKELVVRCECGFETRGTEDQIVPVLQKHAGESHNMKVTRDQVLARARPI
jgi:predicted small metal-binding protein